MDKEIIKYYKNDDITVIWKPSVCIHSTICFKGLPKVFNPKKRPWITLENSTTDLIISQIKSCPSGALSFRYNHETEVKEETIKTEIEILPNGPLIIYGTIEVKTSDNKKTYTNTTTAFCRCGASENKPFCDGSHVKKEFKG